MLDGAVQRQQALLSYIHGFYVVAFLILLIIPVVLLVRYQKPNKTEESSQESITAH
jgi:hypothetical protein